MKNSTLIGSVKLHLKYENKLIYAGKKLVESQKRFSQRVEILLQSKGYLTKMKNRIRVHGTGKEDH